MMNDNTSIDQHTRKLAVLIDGDNAQASLIAKMLTEVGKHGTITVRRIYGDWTTANMNSWKETLHHFALQPIQQFRYTVGKNATDSALIIDAMDILHRKFVEGFCIVSSDSDYTRLATRIREDGFFVMGIGRKTTPKAFVNACDIFIFTENIAPKDSRSAEAPQAPSRSRRGGKSKEKEKEREKAIAYDPVPLLTEAYDMVVGENGWANLGPFGKAILQLDPSFDPRTYGHKQLSQLLKAYANLFEVRRPDENSPTGVYVKLKG